MVGRRAWRAPRRGHRDRRRSAGPDGQPRPGGRRVEQRGAVAGRHQVLFDRYQVGGEHWARAIPTAGGTAVDIGQMWPDHRVGVGPEDALLGSTARPSSRTTPGWTRRTTRCGCSMPTGTGEHRQLHPPVTYAPFQQRLAPEGWTPDGGPLTAPGSRCGPEVCCSVQPRRTAGCTLLDDRRRGVGGWTDGRKGGCTRPRPMTTRPPRPPPTSPAGRPGSPSSPTTRRPAPHEDDDRRRDRRSRDRGRRDGVLRPPTNPGASCSSSAIGSAAARPGTTPGSSRPTSSDRCPTSRDEFGADAAVEGQRAFDDAHDLLDLMVAEAGATVRVERFTGHMGMFGAQSPRRSTCATASPRPGGLRLEACVVSEDAEFLDAIPAEFDRLYTVVPQARIHELLETDDDRYRAVLSDRKGCVNSGAARPAGPRVPRAPIRRPVPVRGPHPGRRAIVVGEAAQRSTPAATPSRRGHAVLCTNGFVDHVVEDAAGDADRAGARPARSSGPSATWPRSSRSGRGRRRR